MFNGDTLPDPAPAAAAGPRAGAWAAQALIGLAAAAVLVALAVGALARWWPKPDAAPTSTDNDPRRTFNTPFRNVRPEVQYVGDQTCGDDLMRTRGDGIWHLSNK